MSIIRRCVVRGRVQGVAYRISCRAEALRLGLHGHAINQSDGSVEVVMMGPQPAVTALQVWLWRGPLLARVETVDILDSPLVVMTGFRIGSMQRRPAPRKADRRDPLQQIPGVGPSLAADLRLLGIQAVSDLRERNPLQLYEQLCALSGVHQDRCVLYVFRCAVHYSSSLDTQGELARWWNWKDRIHPNEH